MKSETQMQRLISAPRTCVWFVFLIPVISALGCGDSLPAAELERAKTALQASLDAWKAGITPKLPEDAAIQFADADQSAGARLVDYTIERCAGRHGENIRCWTKLTVETSQGARMAKEVVFEIRLGEKTTIGRDPFN